MKKYNPQWTMHFNESEYQKKFLVSEIQNKYIWKDGKKTEEVEGIKVSLIELDSLGVLVVNINALDIDSLGVKVRDTVSVIFDNVRSKVFVNKQGFLDHSVWCTLKLVENDGSEMGWL